MNLKIIHVHRSESKNILKRKREVFRTMAKWKCLVCGYIYDEDVGDPEGDIPPGTLFEDLPNDWVCPACGASKDQFEYVEE